jgi:crossover junction endodeoxyribonuclease RusA
MTFCKQCRTTPCQCPPKRSDGAAYVLPFPPTVNTYYRTFRGKMLISAKGREYRQRVVAQVMSRQRTPFAGRLKVSIVVNPPDHRRRDLDNINKGLLDALCHAGVYEDDSQIDQLSITRGKVSPPDGSVVVDVQPIEH